MNNEMAVEQMAESPQDKYFVVSKGKLVLMSLLTLGFFTYYWSFKNWQVIQKKEVGDISPRVRGVFSPIFIFSLARHIDAKSNQHQLPLSFGWLNASICYLITSLMFGVFSFIFIGILQDNLELVNQAE